MRYRIALSQISSPGTRPYHDSHASLSYTFSSAYLSVKPLSLIVMHIIYQPPWPFNLSSNIRPNILFFTSSFLFILKCPFHLVTFSLKKNSCTPSLTLYYLQHSNENSSEGLVIYFPIWAFLEPRRFPNFRNIYVPVSNTNGTILKIF